jgi:hypothetical protein
MSARRAFATGVIGASVMSMLMAVARSVGFPLKLELLLGSFLTRSVDARGWIVGFLLHFLTGGVFGLLYAIGFERWTHRAGLSVGMAFGALHALVTGALLFFVPRAHPLVPDVIVAPGAFMANLGVTGVVAFLGLHLLFGAIVGELDEPMIAASERVTRGSRARAPRGREGRPRGGRRLGGGRLRPPGSGPRRVG